MVLASKEAPRGWRGKDREQTRRDENMTGEGRREGMSGSVNAEEEEELRVWKGDKMRKKAQVMYKGA